MSIGRNEEEVEALNISDADGDEQEGGEEEIDEGDEDRGDDLEDDADIEALAKTVEGKDQDDDAEEEEEPRAQDKGKQRVPYDRFREVNDELKKEREERIRLEERLKLREEQTSADDSKKEKPKEFNFDAAEDAYQDAVLEGDKEKARQIRAEIRAEEIRIAEARAEERIMVRETLRKVEDVTTKAYEKYPFLDHESDDANKDAIAEVVEWRDFYHAKGDSWDKALSRAVEKVGKLYAPKEEKRAKGDSEDDKPKGRNVVDIKQRNAGIEKKIPPAATGASGAREARVDWKSLSDKEWEDLPESEKRKARGDIA